MAIAPTSPQAPGEDSASAQPWPPERRGWFALFVVIFATFVTFFDQTVFGMLSERMKELEARGVVVRTELPGRPPRVEYALTPMGRELEPALEQLEAWALRWLPACDDGPAG